MLDRIREAREDFLCETRNFPGGAISRGALLIWLIGTSRPDAVIFSLETVGAGVDFVTELEHRCLHKHAPAKAICRSVFLL
jgi:hypothetical protein